MSAALKLDPLVYEFDTRSQADEYTQWLADEVSQARLSPVVSHEEAINRLDANRARLLERMKNAD